MKKSLSIFKAILLAAFCMAVTTLFAQYNYSIKNFNTENGLPQNEIISMTMDYDGYLWLGTRTGIIRYDGSSLKNFSLFDKDSSGFSNIVLYIMNIPPDKRTMIKTRGSYVYSIQKGRPVLFSDTSDFSGGIWTRMEGHYPSMKLFEKYYSSIFSNFDDTKINFEQFDLLSVNNSDFFVSFKDSTQLFYFKNGVNQGEVKIQAGFKKFLSSGGYHFLLDNQNNIHLYNAATNRFTKVDIDWPAIKNIDASPVESRFYSDQYSGESFCLHNAVFYLLQFDAVNNTMRFLPQFSLRNNNHFWTGVVYDPVNSIFFLSTLNEGFFKVKLKKIQSFSFVDQFPRNIDPGSLINYAVLKTSDSTTLIPGGFEFIAGKTGIYARKLKNFFGARETLALLPDKTVLSVDVSKLVYSSAADGYNLKKSFNDSFNKYNNVRVLMLQPEGDSLWVSTTDAFFCLTKKEMKILYDKNKVANEDYNEFTLFYRLNKDEAFIANPFNLYRLETHSPYNIEPVPEMKGKYVRHIYPYKDVLIVAVYKHGLYILKDNRFFRVPLAEDMTDLKSCHSTYIDKKGNAWIATDKGLYMSSAASIVESALNQSSSPFFYYYGKDAGIENTEFNGAGCPTFAALNNGQLFYPSMGGIVTFNPADLNDKITTSPVFIEKILIDNEKTEKFTDSIYLKRNFKYLTIEFTTPNFGEPKNLSLEYSLDNTSWTKVPTGNNPQITLVNISSGHHQLMIRKRTGFGNTDYVYTSIFIHKGKHLYERIWFYPVALLLAGLLIWLLIWLKTRDLNRKRAQLQKKVNVQTAELSKTVEVKDLLISIISHDMIAPLRHVSVIAEILEKKLEKDPQRVEQALSDIKLTSRRIMSGSLSIINWIKYNNKRITVDKKPQHLYSLVNEAFDMHRPMAKAKDIALTNEVRKSTFLELDATIFMIILGNIVSNAVKYSDKGEIKVFAEKVDQNGSIIVRVSDTGQGIKAEKLQIIRELLKGNLQALNTADKVSTGLGYIIISELVKIHNMFVSIESEPEKGTTVSLTINDTGI